MNDGRTPFIDFPCRFRYVYRLPKTIFSCGEGLLSAWKYPQKEYPNQHVIVFWIGYGTGLKIGYFFCIIEMIFVYFLRIDRRMGRLKMGN